MNLSEDEPGISEDEATQRFMDRVRAQSRKELKEKEDLRKAGLLSYTDCRIEGEVYKKNTKEAEVQLPTTDSPLPAPEIPVTSIEELRPTPEPLSKQPIHLNSYSPDKKPVSRSSRNESVHSDMLKK